jgi:hypothetical protein
MFTKYSSAIGYSKAFIRRLILQAVALLLIPCLVTDPVMASALSRPFNSNSPSAALHQNSAPELFKQQALAPADLAFLRNALLRDEVGLGANLLSQERKWWSRSPSPPAAPSAPNAVSNAASSSILKGWSHAVFAHAMLVVLIPVALIFSACSNPGGILTPGAPPGTGTSPGTGTPAMPLQFSPMDFGNVPVGSSVPLPLVLKNTGNVPVTVTNIMAGSIPPGPNFKLGAVLATFVIPAFGNAIIPVIFAPTTQTAGNSNGFVSMQVQVGSTAPQTVQVPLAGVGTHSAALSWSETSVVVGYFIYRSQMKGGPYTRLNASPVGTMLYVDNTVQSQQTYYYVVTAVDSNGVESPYSNEAVAIIPLAANPKNGPFHKASKFDHLWAAVDYNRLEVHVLRMVWKGLEWEKNIDLKPVILRSA